MHSLTETGTQESLRYALPADFDHDKFQQQLTIHFDNIETLTAHQRRTYLDTFDWRLYRNNLLCSYIHGKVQNMLQLEDAGDEIPIASAPCPSLPRFNDDIAAGVLTQRIKPMISVRALLPLITLDCQQRIINIKNPNDKTTFTISIIRYRMDTLPFKPRSKAARLNINLLYVQAVKGYALPLKPLRELLERQFRLRICKQNLLEQLTPWLAYAPGSHSGAFRPKLEKQLAAQLASKVIFNELLDTIELNETGILHDLDSEFLHDFRVAIRRTRSGLKYIEQVLPQPRVKRFAQEFAWLVGNSGRLRDLDVLLLKFDQYKAMLSPSLRTYLEPLRDIVRQQRIPALAIMIEALHSKRYAVLKQEWRKYLSEDIVTALTCPLAREPIYTVACINIWQSFQHIIKRGGKIDANSPAEDYHHLRKNGKQLRYLVEFFQSLFPQNEIKQIRHHLTAIQDLLGEFQDLSVQIAELHTYAKGQDVQALPPRTLLAVGALIEKFTQRKLEIRSNYRMVFNTFSSKHNIHRYKTLFYPPQRQTTKQSEKQLEI